jgi:uncharacterized protein (DUF427 family)
VSEDHSPLPSRPAPESVWDYPRPPRVELTSKRIRVIFNGQTIADSRRVFRVLETSHPPSFYIPAEDVRTEFLIATPHRTICEFKGAAKYWTLVIGERTSENAAWNYPEPMPGFQAIKGHYAFYASRVDACYVEDEQVQAQPGDFYGGWITSDIVGPFKGEAGTLGW